MVSEKFWKEKTAKTDLKLTCIWGVFEQKNGMSKIEQKLSKNYTKMVGSARNGVK